MYKLQNFPFFNYEDFQEIGRLSVVAPLRSKIAINLSQPDFTMDLSNRGREGCYCNSADPNNANFEPGRDPGKLSKKENEGAYTQKIAAGNSIELDSDGEDVSKRRRKKEILGVSGKQPY